jgi:hypothetical protein
VAGTTIQQLKEISNGEQRPRDVEAAGDQVGQHAEEDGEEQDRLSTAEEEMILFADEALFVPDVALTG